jgi:hypothetical protein
MAQENEEPISAREVAAYHMALDADRALGALAMSTAVLNLLVTKGLATEDEAVAEVESCREAIIGKLKAAVRPGMTVAEVASAVEALS